MKILVTGHEGFIGGHMLRTLVEQGHDVTGFEWDDNSANWPKVYGYDWVVHMGAISSTVERDVKKILRQNYEFSIWLFEECKHHGVNLQYSSSASVYGLGKDFRETADVDPRNPYAWSKFLFEEYCSKYTHGNIVQGFRYFNVYGPEGEEHKGNQASPHSQFQRQHELAGRIRLFTNSDKYRRDFIHVSKIVDYHVKFFNVGESGLWNLGTGTATSFLDVAKSFNSKLVDIPMPEVLQSNYQEYTCADMSKTFEMMQKYHIIA